MRNIKEEIADVDSIEVWLASGRVSELYVLRVCAEICTQKLPQNASGNYVSAAVLGKAEAIRSGNFVSRKERLKCTRVMLVVEARAPYMYLDCAKAESGISRRLQRLDY